jgi:hypothetical protein
LSMPSTASRPRTLLSSWSFFWSTCESLLRSSERRGSKLSSSRLRLCSSFCRSPMAAVISWSFRSISRLSSVARTRWPSYSSRQRSAARTASMRDLRGSMYPPVIAPFLLAVSPSVVIAFRPWLRAYWPAMVRFGQMMVLPKTCWKAFSYRASYLILLSIGIASLAFGKFAGRGRS